MKNWTFLLTFCLINFTPLLAQSWSTVFSIGGNNNESITGTIEDDFGNLYVSGNFDGSFNLDGTSISYENGQDAFLAKFTPKFKLIWVATFNNDDSLEIVDLRLDAKGGVYAVGNTNADFDIKANSKKSSFNLPTSNLGFDGFVSKFDTSGTLIETFQVGSSNNNRIAECIVGKNNTIIITGKLQNTVSSSDGFVIGTSLNGKSKWTQTLSGVGNDAFTSLGRYANGDIIATGYFFKSADLNNGNQSVNGKETALVMAIYSETGNYLSNYVMDSANMHPKKILISNNNIVVGGEYEGTLYGEKSNKGKDIFIMYFSYQDSLKILKPFLSNTHISSSGNMKLLDLEVSKEGRHFSVIGRSGDSIKVDNELLVQKDQNAFIGRFYMWSWENFGRCKALASVETNEFNGPLGFNTYKTGLLVYGQFSDSLRLGDTSIFSSNLNGFMAWFNFHELSTIETTNKICIDDKEEDSFTVTFNVYGTFDKGNEFYFEISEDSSFSSYYIQKANVVYNRRAQFYVSDTFKSGTYIIRLASSKPKVVSTEYRTLYFGRNLTNLPTITGPDTVTVRQEYTYISLNNHENTFSNTWWVDPVNYTQKQQDTSTAITFSIPGTYIVRTRNWSELGCGSRTAEKSVVVTPYIKVSAFAERESGYNLQRCMTDTFSFYLNTEGHFDKNNWFKIMADTSSAFSNPFVLDSFKSKQNIFGETKEKIAQWYDLDPGKYFVRVQSTSPEFIDKSRQFTLETDKVESSKILGDSIANIGEEATYTLDKGQAFWIAINGTIKSSNYSNNIKVEWYSVENSKLIAIPFYGGCVGDSLGLGIEIINSINEKVQRLNVYPIPTDNNLFVEVDETTKLVVCDISGREVLESTTLHIGLNSINVSRLKTGSYILYLMNEKSVTQQKFTIE